MATADSYQANSFSADEFSRYIPRQPPNLALENAWVSLQHRVHCVMLIHQCVYLFTFQVPPAPANDRREDIPAPDRGVLAEAGRMHDLHHIDVAHQGIVDYHPRPLAVSNFYLSADRPLFDQSYSGNRILHTYFLMWDTRKVFQYKSSPMLQWVSIHFS